MYLEANQIATKADFVAIQKLLEQVLTNQLLAPLSTKDDYLSLEQVAELTGFSTRTVKKWVSEGKYDQKGKRIRLLALEFSPGYLRIPRSALLAYGEGTSFTITDLKTPLPKHTAS